MSASLYRGGRKAVRQVVQMAAAGSLTVLVTALAHGLDPAVSGLVLAFWGVVVVFLHNYLETAGKIPVLLPTPGLVPSVGGIVEPVAGTVETTIDRVGQAVGGVTGTVTDTVGGLLGEVVGVDEHPDEGAKDG